MAAKNIEERDGWLWDRRGNRNEIALYGSRDAAEKALRSLKNCDNCVNCSYCSGCSGCSDCSDCSYCSRCSRCSRCSGCSRCSRCSRCSYCSDCSYCSYCSYCSRCSRCSRCSGCSGLRDKENITEAAAESGGPPPVPVIPDIHVAIFAAVSQPGALDMGTWHTCANTHCRAGWAVALAGREGKALERFYNTELAAMMIYDASAPGFKINPARFYDSNDVALADMRKLAQAQS